jgi:hypothetical protein
MSYLKMQTIKTSDDAFGAENCEFLHFRNYLTVNVLCFVIVPVVFMLCPIGSLWLCYS